MIDLTIDGVQYRSTRKLDAVEQFFLSKRLQPMLGAFAKLARPPLNPDGTTPPVGMDDVVEAIGGAISSIPDDDCRYIFALTLSTVQEQHGGAGPWTTMWNAGAGKLQYVDVSMGTMLQVVYAVVMDNLGSFMPAPPQPLPG